MLTIRTIVDGLKCRVVRHFRCPVCNEHFILVRSRLSFFQWSEYFERDVKEHYEFCKMQQKAKELMEEVGVIPFDAKLKAEIDRILG